MPERSEARSGVPWWAPLLALAVLVAGVAAAAVVSQRPAHERTTHEVLGTQATITEPPATTAPRPAPRSLSSLTGHYVDERRVRVTAVVGDRIFWVARSDGSRVLVHLQGRGTLRAIRRGQHLSFTGAVTRNAPHSARSWGLTWSEGRGRFRAQRAHLEVFGPRIRF